MFSDTELLQTKPNRDSQGCASLCRGADRPSGNSSIPVQYLFRLNIHAHLCLYALVAAFPQGSVHLRRLSIACSLEV